MTSALFEVNKKYWTDRAPSYSQVNQEELAGCQQQQLAQRNQQTDPDGLS